MRINLRLLAAAATALLLTATTAVVAAVTGGGLVVVGPVGHVVEQRLHALQQRLGFGLRAADHLG